MLCPDDKSKLSNRVPGKPVSVGSAHFICLNVYSKRRRYALAYILGCPVGVEPTPAGTQPAMLPLHQRHNPTISQQERARVYGWGIAYLMCTSMGTLAINSVAISMPKNLSSNSRLAV